jgi:hypothetical protein
MYPRYHIIFGFILSIVLFLVFPAINLIGAGIIFLSSFLIDADHYIYCLFKKRDLNFSHALKHFIDARKKISRMPKSKRKDYYSGFCFLHGIEILIIFLLLGISLSRYFLFVFIGFALHIVLDISEELYYHQRIDKISLIYDWFKFKKLKVLE